MSEFKWDFTTEDCYNLAKTKEIYFDPTKSYELTKYRPINEEAGLDFDPAPFQAVGAENMRSGKYSGAIDGSKAHRDWWVKQIKYCNKGFEHNGYRVTGDYYFFLNFFVMDSRGYEGNKKIHPKFWAAHYAFFHYIEMCELLRLDALLLKARGIGGSEIAASLAVGPYATKPRYQSLFTAGAEKYLWGKGILSTKAWPNLDYLDMKTENALAHARSKNSEDLKKAGVLYSNNKEDPDSWGAVISGQVIVRPDDLRGDRINRVFNSWTPGDNCWDTLRA